MKIRLKTTMAGPELTAIAGAIVDVSVELARNLIAGGYAEAIEQAKAKPRRAAEPKAETVEMAELKPPERAVGRGGRRSRKIGGEK